MPPGSVVAVSVKVRARDAQASAVWWRGAFRVPGWDSGYLIGNNAVAVWVVRNWRIIQ